MIVHVCCFPQAQQDQQDDTLAQLQEGLQEHLQQQFNNSSHQSEHPQVAADTEKSTSAVQAAMEGTVTGASACTEAPKEPAAATADDAATTVSARRAASVASGGSGEDEWHLVSPHGSVRMPCSSGRYSFEYAGVYRQHALQEFRPLSCQGVARESHFCQQFYSVSVADMLSANPLYQYSP